MGYDESKSSDEELEDIESDQLPQDNAEAVSEDEFEESIEDIDEKIEGKPVKKKVAALKARHAIEDYFEMKKIRHELDYLEEDEDEKQEGEEKK